VKDIDNARDYLDSRAGRHPCIGVVLGSGLGAFAGELDDCLAIPYSEIPHWPRPSAVGHAGELVFGNVGGKPVAVLSGRVHLYEGYSPAQVVFGVRVLARLGVRALVLTCAAGGINVAFRRGGLVLFSDHLNLQGANPLVGLNEEALGPRFPDMSEVYSLRLRTLAHRVGAELGIPLEEGVYAALLGPSFETPAEIRYLRAIGADLVGMSTVPEAIAANHMGLEVLALACVTNLAAGILPQKLNHEEVLETGEMVRETLVRFLKALLPRLEV
jgi:purine-nucleoside phosphorylase